MTATRQNASWKLDRSATNANPTSDPLAIIYNEGLWRISKVTPLHKMQFQLKVLKKWAAKVRQGLVSAVQSTTARYSVVFEEQPHLRYSEDDASGLLITVTTSQNTTKTKVAYTAILLSWGVHSTLEQATHLPYMLERGEQIVGTSVRATLQSLFDCNICQFSFTQHQLLQFGFNFVDNDSSKSTNPFTLVYRTPQAEVKDKLSLSFEVGDITVIWNGMKDLSAHPSELVSQTYQLLHNHIFHTKDMDVSVLDLCEINLSKAEIKCNGAVKMKTPEMVNCVFTVLNEICAVHYNDVCKVFDDNDKENITMDE